MSRLGNIGGKLHRGEVSLDFVGRQKIWYLVSGLILAVSIASLLTLGLNFGIEFKGGTVFQFPTKPGVSTSDARAAVTSSGVVKEDPIVQRTGTGWRVQTESLTSTEVTKVQDTVQQRFGLSKPDDVSPQTVGASWGKDISSKALEGLIVFLVAIGITADSFVVFFERLRDEVRDGHSLRTSVERGWRRARRTIIVADAVSFLAALLLYIFSIGGVRGFAFTLGLTTLIDVVVVFFFTKPLVSILARTKFFGRGHRFSGLDPTTLGVRKRAAKTRTVGTKEA